MLTERVKELWADEGGGPLMENGLYAAIVVVGAIVGLTAIVSAVRGVLQRVATDISNPEQYWGD